MGKPNLDDYPVTDARTFILLDGSYDWKKYALALDEHIQELNEYIKELNKTKNEVEENKDDVHELV